MKLSNPLTPLEAYCDLEGKRPDLVWRAGMTAAESSLGVLPVYHQFSGMPGISPMLVVAHCSGGAPGKSLPLGPKDWIFLN